MSDDLKKIKVQVEEVLERNPKARNSDKELAILVWKTFYPNLVQVRDGGSMIFLADLYELPSYDTISRWRRKFQEENRFPPTDEKIAIERGWKTDDWLAALGRKRDLFEQ